MKTRNVLWALVADVIGIIVFVAIGRRNHDEGVAPTGVIETAAPFLIALLIGWLIARAWNEPLTTRTGTIIWVTTVALGMVLRKFVFDDGTATAFVIVAAVFTGLVLNGWRLASRSTISRL
ncbi:MAG: DUF3054 domain-containing protein [Actinobacteria bacterium]|nr:DUF3054 domain-containing protein [Actinomycetota bacterium]